MVEARGHRFLLADGETLPLVKGDHMKVVDVLPSCFCPSGLKINFKGFVVASQGTHILARFYVSLSPASFDYLILNVNDRSHMVLRPGDTLPISARDEICLDDVKTNLHGEKGFHLSIDGYELRAREKQSIGRFFRGPADKNKYEALVKKNRIVLGKINFSLQ
ncbi:MAG: hypothetical protein JRJ50_00125 [Deltaproteobacteria bacterium]|nr:hypothetical protein [Deltaproteobacteria bacterium]